MTTHAHLIDARALLFVGNDQLWTGPIHNEQALRSLEQHCLKACVPLKVMWSQADLIAADTVLRLATERSEYCWGGKRGYSVQVARLRPANNEHGSGGTEGRATGRNPGYGCVGQPSVLAKAGLAQDDGYKQGGALTSRVSSRGPLPPLNTGAGDAAGNLSPAAESEATRRPPSLYSWFLWLIGVTR